MIKKLQVVIYLLPIFYSFGFAQKVLQLEKIGKVETTKIYLGEPFFLRTQQNPDVWFEAAMEDIIVEAGALVFSDRIIQIKDIVAIKRNKKSAMYGVGKAVQFSAIVPVGYEILYGLVNPPIEWKSLGIFAGGSFIVGSLLKLIPPKQHKMTKKYRLRVLDLTF